MLPGKGSGSAASASSRKSIPFSLRRESNARPLQLNLGQATREAPGPTSNPTQSGDCRFPPCLAPMHPDSPDFVAPEERCATAQTQSKFQILRLQSPKLQTQFPKKLFNLSLSALKNSN
jgi:hypothetical protein